MGKWVFLDVSIVDLIKKEGSLSGKPLEQSDIRAKLEDYAETVLSKIAPKIYELYKGKENPLSEDKIKKALTQENWGGVSLDGSKFLLDLLSLYVKGKTYEKTLQDIGVKQVRIKESHSGNPYFIPMKELTELLSMKGKSRGQHSEKANNIGAEKPKENIIPECFLLNAEYWEDIAKKCIDKKDSILKNFYLRADETLTQEIIVIDTYEASTQRVAFHKRILETRHKNEKGTRAEKFEDFIDNCFLLNCSVLVKIIAPSGEGKTVFLNQIAFEYSQLFGKCQVFHITNFTLETIAFMKSEIEEALLPLLFILDTPSKYAEILNENFSVVCEKNYRPLVMIVGDQEGRFNLKLSGNSWESKFENYFSEVYQVDFELTQNEKQGICKKILSLLNSTGEFSDEKGITIKGIFNSNLQLTIRELIYKITKYLEGNFTTKHVQDWDVWEQITKDEPVLKFKALFPFVALFAFFEIPVPISLFNHGYLPQLTEENVEEFISLQSNKSIIRIINKKLELRHEQIPIWYFDIPQYARNRERVVKKFLNDFERELDPSGCYLFRNIQVFMEEENLLENFSLAERKKLLKSYFDKAGFTDPDWPKVIGEIAKLEEKNSDKINWLTKVIEANKNDFHARTFAVQILIDDEQYESAQVLLDELFANSTNVTRALHNQFVLDLKSRSPYTAERYIRLAHGKADFYLSLCKLARYMRFFKEATPVAFEILTHLKSCSPENPLAPMALAHIYRRSHKPNPGREMAILELKYILARNAEDIPARLLLSDIYITNKQTDKAEETLQEGIKIKPNVVAFYVNLVRLYRENKEFIKDSVTKSGEILRKGLDLQSFGLSMEIRTEYAKWCFENFGEDVEKHKTAIAIHLDTIRLYPNHIHSRTELGIIYQKSKFFINLEASVSILNECFTIRSSNKQVAFRVVLANTHMLINTKESWKEAREILEAAKSIAPGNQPTYLGLIKIYQYFNDKKKLKDTINKVELSAKKMGKYFTSIAQHFLNAGQTDEALGILKEALIEDGDNFYILDQIAQIFLYRAKNEGLVAGFDSAQKINSILLLAEEYLLRSLSKFRSNEYTLYLLIRVYDGLKYNIIKEISEYENAVKLRNELIGELYRLNKNNLYLALALSQIFLASWRPMLAIFILESCDINSYTLEEKRKFLIQLKFIYKLFNNIEKINEITHQVNDISRKSMASKNLAATFNKGDFSERNNYRLLKLFNEGYIIPPFKSIEMDGDIIPITPENIRIHNQIKDRQKVYFATYEVDNKIVANNIEPYFDKLMILNLLDDLPHKLNCIVW